MRSEPRALLDEDKILVIGSQAIHGLISELPEVAERSIEVDVASLQGSVDTKADLIDGAIGELSVFQDTFGYYVQGVVPETAVLPEGWRDRLVRFESPNKNGITAMCLEVHDLWLSKAVAGREKDKEFCDALLGNGVVDKGVILARFELIPNLPDAVREKIAAQLDPMGKD